MSIQSPPAAVLPRFAPPAPDPAAADCPVISPEPAARSKQKLAVNVGISAESVGATGICLHLITIPPGGRGFAHLHEGHETAIYAIAGVASTCYGPNLEHRATIRAGDFHYIPAGVPHLPFNASADEPFVAVVARTDPKEQESVVLLPELEAVAKVPGSTL